MATRSRVETTRPNPRYAGRVSTISPLPWSYKEAFNDPNWRNAMFDDLAISQHWSVHQLDVKNAFLQGDLAETVYMHQPPNFCDPEHPNSGDDITFLLLYVDYIVLTASSDRLLQQIIASLHREFSMTDLGALNYFLGILVTRDSSGIFLSQRKYAMEILEHARRVGYNPSRTPIDTESKLGDGGTPVVDPTLYRSLAVQHQRTKHIEIDIHFVRDMVATGQVYILHVPSQFQYADIFTKGFPLALFDEFYNSLSVHCTPAPTAAEY
uniref:Reverse transcriptase Ty1/copia-type domain-containing protein n=1 Tax=Tanacetum cinerariifolium TaxID=118510 RepID=A0A6L2MDL4_TANCI|nr:hypothetical protein [Tanacetum cinerariifolium]